MAKYSMEIEEFVVANVKGRSNIELAKLVNDRFGTEFTASKMRAFKGNRNLRSGLPLGMKKGEPTKLYPKEVQDFIRNNVKGNGPKDMTRLLNEVFGTSYTFRQLKSYYGNRGLNSGMTGYFQKGHVPSNKGKKGYHSPGCEKGWFKKGNRPPNYLPVGSERLNADGYVDVKVEDPNKWKSKHFINWEEVNGPVPEGHVLVFADGNRLNTDVDNLILVTKKQLLIMNRNRLIKDDAELTRTGALVAELFEKIYEKKKG